MKNKLRLLFVVISVCCLLSGCCVREASRIYTICKQTETTTYVYDAEQNFYTYADGKVTPCYQAGLRAKPCLVLRFDGNTDYTLTPEIPSVYSGTQEDALHYVTSLLLEYDGVYSLVSVDNASFEILVNTEEFCTRLLYTSDDKVRIYTNAQDGDSIIPLGLEE